MKINIDNKDKIIIIVCLASIVGLICIFILSNRKAQISIPDSSQAVQSTEAIAVPVTHEAVEINTDVTKGIVFSRAGGFYKEAFELELAGPEDCVIYYTLDGSDPNTDSNKYADPITISNRSGSGYNCGKLVETRYFPESIHMGTVVRAIAVDSAGDIKFRECQTFFVGIKDSSEYKNLPVISLTTDPDNLFDYFSGIYVSGRGYEDALISGESPEQNANYNKGWVKDAYIEYFEADKVKTYQSDVQLSVIPNNFDNEVQKGLILAGGNPDEKSSLSSYLNSESSRLMLHNNEYDNNYKLRELIARDLLENTQTRINSLDPCVLFIDGEYWGIYLMRSNYDAAYIRDEFGVSAPVQVVDDISDTSEPGYSDFMSLAEYIANNDMSDANNYEAVCNQLDIQSYLDYLCANIYLANPTYGTGYWAIWRTQELSDAQYCDNKWRYLCGHLDMTMNNGYSSHLASTTIDTFLLKNISEDSMLSSLMKNPDFRAQFSATMDNYANNIMTLQNVNGIITKYADLMKKPAISNYERFYGPTADDFYSSEVKKIKDFFGERADYVLRYTEEFVN